MLSIFHFFVFQITPTTVKELTKEELESLGVVRLGDQKRLRAACNLPATSNGLGLI